MIAVDPKTESRTSDEWFALLFAAYAEAAASALAHLNDLDGTQIAYDACRRLTQAVEDALLPSPCLSEPVTIEELERSLKNLLNMLRRSDSRRRLASHPSTAFPQLAEAIRAAAPLWNGAQVLFLLDDVSTRHLEPQRIEELLSALIFQNPVCAFKLTSEAQTIFLTLKSPGQVHPAAAGRDFVTFDLGAEVHSRLKQPRGKAFIDDILNARARVYSAHPRGKPSDVLGDVDLETIAEEITNTQPRSRDRKKLYRGLSALAGVCVGDIGSVIQIYHEIISRGSTLLPVPAQQQNDVFQDSCAKHLYNLDRRGSDLKQVATSFAEASHELLMQSGRGKPTGRLRQYTSIYVRVTSGDFQKQMSRLRELVDAGVFVFTGGAPRTKTHDSNPTHQFKLTFRKIFGLVNFIGLAERDRFELSGSGLEEWLSNPANAKDVLVRNLSRTIVAADDDVDSGSETETDIPVPRVLERVAAPQLQFDLLDAPRPEAANSRASTNGQALPAISLPVVRKVAPEELAGEGIETLVLGLGFEERTSASFERLLRQIRPSRIFGVRYDLLGRTDEMRTLALRHGATIEEINDCEAEAVLSGLIGRTMVDITGLNKSRLFSYIRTTLRRSGRVNVAYTGAQCYYPLEADLASVLEAH